MNLHSTRHAERGATLIVGLIMLAVITLMVVSAFTLSSTNLKSVGNIQFRDEAIAAANKAIGQVIDSGFANSASGLAGAQQVIDVDLNNDGTPDYHVNIAAPTCTSRAQVIGTATTGVSNSVTLAGLNNAPPASFNLLWDIRATVTDAVSGASVEVHEGVRVQRTQVIADQICPQA